MDVALPNGTAAGFQVSLHYEPTGPRYSYIRDDEGSVLDWPPISPSDYPQTMLPYCDGLKKYLALYPEDRSVFIGFGLASGADPHGSSLLPNSTWGRDAFTWLDIYGGSGSGSRHVLLATGLIF